VTSEWSSPRVIPILDSCYGPAGSVAIGGGFNKMRLEPGRAGTRGRMVSDGGGVEFSQTSVTSLLPKGYTHFHRIDES
jgi:hypothetical protein